MKILRLNDVELLAGGVADESPRPALAGCGICGGLLVEIRGRYPHTAKREVCPTCLAERMDQIRELSDRQSWDSKARQRLRLPQY